MIIDNIMNLVAWDILILDHWHIHKLRLQEANKRKRCLYKNNEIKQETSWTWLLKGF